MDPSEPTRQILIEVGDTILNPAGLPVVVTSIERCKSHGLLVRGDFVNTLRGKYEVFVPAELPPVGWSPHSWYNWVARADLTLLSGGQLGEVSWNTSEMPLTVEECTTRWKETLAQISAEQAGERWVLSG